MQVRRETRLEIVEAARRLANRYLPTPCVVLDIALTDSGYKLVEFNPINSSGWYAADIGSVLDEWIAWSRKNMVWSLPLVENVRTRD